MKTSTIAWVALVISAITLFLLLTGVGIGAFMVSEDNRTPVEQALDSAKKASEAEEEK